MAFEPRILGFLETADDPAADAALVAGLTEVDAALQCRLVEILLARETAAGLSALIELYDQLAEAGKTHVVAGVAKLFTTLRNAARSSVAQTRQNCLTIIRASGNPRLAYLVALALHDGSAKIRADAGAALREMTERHLHEATKTVQALRELDEPESAMAVSVHATLRLAAEEKAYLLSALKDALGGFESHPRPEVIEAAMAFADELEGSFFGSSTLKRGKLTHAVLEVISNSIAPRYALFACIALGHAELRKKMSALFGAQKDTEFFIELIRLRWLALDPAVGKSLKALRAIGWLGNGFGPAFMLPAEAAAAAPSWVMSLGLPADEKAAVLRNFLLIDHPEANRSAAWALIKIDSPASTAALEAALEHEDERVRTMAQREVEYRRQRRALARGPRRTDRPAAWSHLLDPVDVGESFESLWENFERLDARQALSAGDLVVRYVDEFGTHLATRLCDSQPLDRARALRLMCTFNLAQRFRSYVFQLANDPAPDVRAAAMAALAQIGDATARRILERALHVEAAVVQAAALEALDAVGHALPVEALEPLANNEDASLRATAVRSLLRKHDKRGATALLEMLRDASVEHRCSALWVIDQLHLTAMAGRVAELAKIDPDPRIARSAAQVARRLRREGAVAGRAATTTEATAAQAGPGTRDLGLGGQA